jgi:hypothetical protein
MEQPPSHPAGTEPDRQEPNDPIEALRAELGSIQQRPVVDRVARFEQANAVLAAALAELDEV